MKNLYIVSTPIGNLNDITFRAIETLKKVNLIVCEDTRVSSKLLHHYNILDKKLISYNNFNENSKTQYILDLFKDNNDIALISDAGTPNIADPGYLLVNECYKNNINVIPIPGVSSPIVALSASSMPCDKFIFLGFLDKNHNKKYQQLYKFAQYETTLICFESPHRLIDTLNVLLEVYGGNHNICIAREMTKKFEEFSIKNILEQIDYFSNKEILGEFVLVISPKIIDNNDIIDNTKLDLEIKENINKIQSTILSKELSKKYGISRQIIYNRILELKTLS
jgi:16S rRNA (cytidine1402-2'-O)-methyltransferase